MKDKSHSTKHIHFNARQDGITKPSSSTGFLPSVDPPSRINFSNSNGSGFLDKYKQKSDQRRTTTNSFAQTTHGFLGKEHSTQTRSINAHSSDNLVVVPGFSSLQTQLEQCPPLNFQEICDTCCSPQKPICSDDPNCHMLKECRSYSLGETCKYLRGRGPRIPSWLAHCGRVLPITKYRNSNIYLPNKQIVSKLKTLLVLYVTLKVLIFHAYFQEPVPESDKETYRIRQVNIRYYMDDGTVDVYEPKTFDPGFVQGRLIRRHRIPLPPPADSQFYTMEHFNVGCEVELYGKTFLICGCNDSTRKYLNKLGVPVPNNLTPPEDPYTNWRKDRITSLFARKARIDLNQGKFQNFLLKNQKVLRFWAFWDDRCQYDGYLRKFVVHYYLEDDTIEIKEIPHNTRTDVFPTFLNRGKLYKDYKELVTIPGNKEEALLILNTTGGCHNVFMGHTYLEDRLCPGIDEKPYVKDRDLAIGAVLNVYGRAFILTECDEFTKVYYREKYGIQDFTPLTLTDEETQKEKLPRMKTPLHIGIGDEEDTRQNWDRLEPYPPRKDELRLLALSHDILGFEARLYKTQHRVNGDRRFVINYFMADNTIKIFEKGHPNTGMKQGTFLQRCLPRKSENGVTPRFELGDSSEYYQPAEFYIGVFNITEPTLNANISSENGFIRIEYDLINN